MKFLKTLPVLAGAAVLLSACADEIVQPISPDSPLASISQSETVAGSEFVGSNPEPTGSYIVLTRSGRIASNLYSQLEAAGGAVTHFIPEIGVAIVAPISEDFQDRAARIQDVESVTPDYVVQWIDPSTFQAGEAFTAEATTSGTDAIGSTAVFRSFQWAPDAIDAPQAWASGFTGQGVRVAILDGGIFDDHLDLTDNIDRAASRSFTTGEWNSDTGTFWHGTHVAGIVAASGDVGVVGIAPRATLVGVKVLHSGSGPFASIINGIVYASKPQSEGGAGAHVINMSLGATLNYRDNWGSKAYRDSFRELTKAVDRATRYAYQQGTTVIASAGNGATNFDVARELFKIPAQNEHVISVSATGPHGWGFGNTNFHNPAYYSDYGKSLVDISAPGGTVGLAIVDGNFNLCTIVGEFRTITNTCAVFDQVMSTVRGTTTASYNWAQGTSMAAPAAAGVAALIVERNGGRMSPHAVRTALHRTTADIGIRGNHEFYGHGWVNAARAVGVTDGTGPARGQPARGASASAGRN